ncbi:MAG: hypothetical protein LUG98_16235 [Tannerellaceae bacterium]|nr:hypothetical protein [Tannerellaceae bacterium]
MKTREILIVCMWVVLSMNAVIAQNPATEKFLAETVQQLDHVTTQEERIELRNRFERISSMEPDAWLPLYYQAYTDINLFFSAPQTGEKWLADAEECLEKLREIKRLPKEVQSEIVSLRGYYYFALMALNPAQNGPKYSGNTLGLYGEALKLNPDNPRAIQLNALLQQQVAAFMGGSYAQLGEDMEKAARLHAEEDKESVLPHWVLEIVF